ncbi:MAG: GAF domain-containing protein [Gammaproteobacteria bacterium]
MAELDILRTNRVLRESERRIVHLNRVYAMLSGIGSLIVRVRDRNELFKEACRVAVEAGGFLMALIGIIDRRTQLVTPVASAGKNEEILDAVKRIVSSREIASTSMVGRAVVDKRAILSNDSQNDPQVLLREKYAQAGVKSMAVLPLLVENEAVGVSRAVCRRARVLSGGRNGVVDGAERQYRICHRSYRQARPPQLHRLLR